jgi:regulator of sigma E protease
VPATEAPRAFNRQPVGSRIAIVLAGPAFNFLFAILVYALMFMVGVPGVKPVLDDPRPGSLAEAGGFRKGDRIVAIDGKPTPTLNAAMLELVDRVMAEELIQVEVRDEEGRVRVRILDARDAPNLREMVQVLDRWDWRRGGRRCRR